MHDLEVWPGRAYPLGANFDGTGTNFALYSEVAEGVDLCLFDDEGQERRVALEEVDAFSWHAYLPNIEPGQRYGYRSEEHTSELQSRVDLVCRLLLEKKKRK